MKNLEEISLRALQFLPPETAHELTLSLIKLGLAPKIDINPNLQTNLCGLQLRSPVGLAAGFDKNALVFDEMLQCGFGFVECGTVTPLPQSGNPKPRIFRLKSDQAVINALGFNNMGLDNFADSLAKRKIGCGIVGANIGANKDSLDKIADYVVGLKRVWQNCSYVTINISSPNTKGLRDLQSSMALEELLGRISVERQGLFEAHGRRPIFLKIAPDISDSEVVDISRIAIAAKIDALIISNTTIERPFTLKSANRNRSGGLSGRPLFERSTEKLRDFNSAVDDKISLIGVGGISSGDMAVKKLEAGATAIQLYTGMIYQGMGLIAEINDAVAEFKAK